MNSTNPANTPLSPVHRDYRPGQADEARAKEVTDLLTAVEEADGVSAYSEAFFRAVTEGTEGYRHLVSELGGKLVGVASVDSADVAEIAVHPDARRQRVATSMLRELGSRIDGERQVSIWSHGDLAAAQGFADRRGARTVRELLKMSVDCSASTAEGSRREDLLAGRDAARQTAEKEGLTVLDYPSACEEFGEQKVDAEWLRVNNEAFAWHPEQGGWDEGKLRRAREVDWFDPEGVLFLFDGDECLGVHWTKRPDGDSHGEVYVVCLADAARGRGLGAPMTYLGVGFLIDGGAEAVDLYVEGDNQPAVATYRKMGFDVVHRDVVYRGMI